MANAPTNQAQVSGQVWVPKGKFSEADLARIWAGQSFPPVALAFANGQTPRVILPGHPGGSAGPDFRNAVIAIDGDERRGDVELHLHASSFRSHGHHKDLAYNRVVLHVVVWADGEAETMLNNGRPAPVAAFETWLAKRSEELSDWLEEVSVWREPCATAAQRLGEEAVDGVLAAEGEARFNLKTGRLLDTIAALGEPAAFWQALLDGLGYGGDRSAWRRLSLALPADQLTSMVPTNVVEPLLMAVAGFSPWPKSVGPVVQVLNPAMKLGSRPANDPRNRLAALARLWQRANGDLPGFALSSLRESTTVRQLVSRW